MINTNLTIYSNCQPFSPPSPKLITTSELKTVLEKYNAVAREKNTKPFPLYTWLKMNGFSTTLTHLDLSQLGDVLSQLDLSYLTLENCYLSQKTTFSECYLYNIVFQSCDLSNAVFRHDCHLKNMHFKSCNFGSADFQGVVGGSDLIIEDCQNIPKRYMPPSPTSPSPNPSQLLVPGRIHRSFHNPSAPFTDFGHELYKDFEGTLNARCTTLKADGNSYTLGSYFHGYGRELVKGSNLRFKKQPNGIELSFRLNTPYHNRLRGAIRELSIMSPAERAHFAKRFQAEGIEISFVNYFTGEPATLRSGDILCAYAVHLPGVGIMIVGEREWAVNICDNIRVILNDGANLESFHSFLSVFGLEDVLKKSTPEDLERIKLSVALKTFFPSYASTILEDESFFTLPVEEVKQKLFQQLPKLREYLMRYPVEGHELLPGYWRQGVVLDQKAYTLGARALTTALTSLDQTHFGLLPDQSVGQLTTILENGLFSKEIRQQADINSAGLNVGDYAYQLGGARSVYTQFVTQKDVDQKKHSFGYSAPARLLISLEALNQGSYQYEYDNHGAKKGDVYNGRSPLPTFLKKDVSILRSHEVMLPDRILPKHIMAVIVESEKVKGQMTEHLKARGLVQDGKINNIDINDFIRVGGVTEEAVRPCYAHLSQNSKDPRAKL